MKEKLQKAIDFATNSNVNEMGREIGEILQQKIADELRSLKVDIARDTYNFGNEASATEE